MVTWRVRPLSIPLDKYSKWSECAKKTCIKEGSLSEEASLKEMTNVRGDFGAAFVALLLVQRRLVSGRDVKRAYWPFSLRKTERKKEKEREGDSES